MSITQRDCFLRTVTHEPHEGILADASFSPDLARRLRERYGLAKNQSINRHFGLFEPQAVAPNLVEPMPESAFYPYYRDVDMPEGSSLNPNGVLHVPAECYHFKKIVSPLRNVETLEEIQAYPFLDYSMFSEEGMTEKVQSIHDRDLTAVGTVGHIFETAWQIRGMEPFLMDMIAEPEKAEYIFDRLYELQKARACAMAHAGVDYIHTGDDVATQQAMMFNVDLWRYYLKSRWGDIYKSVKEIHPDIKVWYHSDGDITDIIPELIEIGVDILNPVQPECMDPYEIKRAYGNDLTLWGCMGTQTTMPFSTAEEVRDTVKNYVEELGKDGALILAPTHMLEPEVPIENVEAFVETVQEYGYVLPAED